MSPVFAQVGGSDVAERWVSMATWSDSMGAVVILAGILILVLTLFNVRVLDSGRQRLVILTLRALVVTSLLTVFFQPALLVEKHAREASHVAVLIDTSTSMNLAPGGPGTASRLDGAKAFLREHHEVFEGLADRHVVHVDEVHGALKPLEGLPVGAALDDLKARGGASHLVAALEAVRIRHHGEHLAGVILLTDGLDTSESGVGVPLLHEARRTLESLEAPLHLVIPEPSPELKDAAIRDLGTSGFAFLLNATSIEARLEARGLAGEALRLELLLEGRVVSERTVTPSSDHLEETVRFDFVPRRLGEQVAAVRVHAVEGEIHLENNVVQRPIQVIRDRIRVLQIVGQPSWDERFLRNHLKEDPNVELISFFILVNPLSLRPLNAADTALIPFPAQELFEEELGGFDLVIFQNFNYGPFQTRQYLPDIAQYVREGGAFLMIGGPLSLASGGYYGTPITEILPVAIPAGFASEGLIDTKPFVPELTRAGANHPAIRLAEDPEEHRRKWPALEPLHGVNMVTSVQPNSVVLATHPTLRDGTGEPMAVVALRDVGQGRSMVVTTDSTWRWHFVTGNRGGDTHGYTRFWSSAIRWLIRDPGMSLIQVDVAGDQHEPAVVDTPKSRAMARVQVVRPDFQPAIDHPVDVVVRRRDPGAGAGVGEVVLALDQERTNGEGILEVMVPTTRPGIMEVVATTRVASGRVATASDLFVVSGATTETERTVADGEWLAALAEATSGSVQTYSSTDPVFGTAPPQRLATLSRHHHELWASPWVLAWVALLAGSEWWLRRRWGLL